MKNFLNNRRSSVLLKQQLGWRRILLMKLILLLSTIGFSNSAFAQTAKEKACYNAVQGTVAWNQNGNTRWSDNNIKALCKGVNQPEKRISCFAAGISAHNSWQKATKDCQNTGTIVSRKKVSGKQCIYNKGGYALDVDWYDPGQVVFLGGNTSDYNQYLAEGKPHKTDRVTLGYSSCTDIANRVAIARIVGHDITNAAITISAGVAAGVTSSFLGAFACVGTAGAGCPAAVGAVTVLTAGAVSATALALPKTEEIAYIGVPGTKNYLDMYGTVWEPAISNTVSLSQKRKPIKEGFDKFGNIIQEAKTKAATAIGGWITGGTPGPKSITFSQQGVFAAKMTVIWHENKIINGVPIPEVKSFDTGMLTLGFSRHINIPSNIAENMPVLILIEAVGTVNNNVFSTSLPANFKGNKCYKAWGSPVNTQGGKCS